MKIDLFIFYSMLLFIGCNSNAKNKKVEYYNSGAVKSISEYLDTLKHGESIEYFENGNYECISQWKYGKLEGETMFYTDKGDLFAIVHYKNGLKNGSCIDFYDSNGNVRSKANYRKDLLHGTVIQYFEKDSGKVMARMDYINYQGKQKSYGGIWYDNYGNVLKETRRVSVTSIRDTVSFSENMNLCIELLMPRFDSTVFIVGNYDEEFYIKDSSSLDTLSALNHKYQLSVKPLKKGENYIRGYAKNWRLIERNELETVTEEVLPIYFEHSYYVR
jgi:antitoxin component YwqK of YwqJK toxin-antitoxin module